MMPGATEQCQVPQDGARCHRRTHFKPTEPTATGSKCFMPNLQGPCHGHGLKFALLQGCVLDCIYMGGCDAVRGKAGRHLPGQRPLCRQQTQEERRPVGPKPNAHRGPAPKGRTQGTPTGETRDDRNDQTTTKTTRRTGGGQDQRTTRQPTRRNDKRTTGRQDDKTTGQQVNRTGHSKRKSSNAFRWISWCQWRGPPHPPLA